MAHIENVRRAQRVNPETNIIEDITIVDVVERDPGFFGLGASERRETKILEDQIGTVEIGGVKISPVYPGSYGNSDSRYISVFFDGKLVELKMPKKGRLILQ